MSHTQKHRHFVVFPFMLLVFSLLLGAQFVLPLRPLRASSVNQDVMIPLRDMERSFSSGVRVVLDQGALMTTSIDGELLRLNHGGALIDVLGYNELQIGCVRIETLHATFYVSKAGDTLTVASVEGPLLVRLCSGTSRVLSDQRQFIISSDGSTTQYSVDQFWRRSQLAKLESLKSAMLIHADTSVAFPRSKADRSLLLAKFFAQSGSYDPEQFSVALKQIDALDTDGFLHVLFGLASIRSSSSTEADSIVLGALDSASALRSDVVEAILRSLLISPVAFTEGAHDFWLKNAQTVAVAQPEFMLALLKDASVLPTLFDEQQLPKQALLWRQAFTDILQTLEVVAPALRSDIFSVRSFLTHTSEGADEESHAVEDAPVQPTTVSVVDTQEMQQRTKEMLLHFGVLFTPETRLLTDPTDPLSIRVTGVLVADHGRDVRYEFSYMSSRNLLHSFVRDAVRLPNALTPEQFFGHMKKASM